jgi:hypothetical protein
VWLRPTQVVRLAQALPRGPGVGEVVLSAQLAPPEETALPLAWRRDVRWISARSDPQRRRGNGQLGLVPWATHMRLAIDDDTVLPDIYAATFK